jgi:predicted dehydrogenase
MEQVRVAIVGLNIGKPMARGFVKSARGRVAALCDIVESRMREFEKELPEPVKCYTDYLELCRDPEIDALFVGTPNQWHVPIALEAVRNGKHVLVIKPLADSLAAAEELVTAAEASGVVNMMALVNRWNPATRYFRKMIAEGEFGEVYYGRARSIRRSGIPSWSLGFVQSGGGAFRDVGVHVLDAAWWMMGMPRPVAVTGVAGAKFGPRGQGYWEYKPQPELGPQFAADDYGGGFIRFANGAGLQIESFWASHQAEDRQIEIFGTEAGAKLYPPTVYRTLNGAPEDSTIEFPKGPDSWEAMATHFCECILDGVECESPLRHGLIVQEMLEAVLTSGATGHEVPIGGSVQ